MRRWLRRIVGLAGLGLIAAVAVLVFAPGWVLPPVARFLDVSEPPRQADYVLVLNGEPQTRPFAAAALVKASLAREVLLTRQNLTLESSTVQDGSLPSELELTKKVLRARGLSDEAIRVLPGEIGNTAGEARVLRDFLDVHPGATVTIVTNRFHTRRARKIFQRVLQHRSERVHFVGVPLDGIDEANWWRTRHGCATYLCEYAKLGYYTVR